MTDEKRAKVELRQIAVGSLQANCYVLVCPESKESVIVDPGDEGNKILKLAEGTTVKHILLTHGHGDHIGALGRLRSATRAPVGAHPADQSMLNTEVDFNVADGDIIRFGKRQIRVICTPGHTPGSAGR